MRELFLNQIDNNLSVIIEVLTLRDKRYDLYFKMHGGQNAGSYKALRDLKNKFVTVKQQNSLNEVHLVLNPDGKVCKNLYLISFWLLTDLIPEVISKKIAFAPTFDTDEKWLRERFNEEEVSEILMEKNTWIKKMTK